MLNERHLTVIEGDARVSCRHLREVLGFARIDHLHRLIKSNWDELEDFGAIFLFEGEKSGRGRKSVNYYLNEHQATAICMWAGTTKARAARRLIVEVFTRWRRGEVVVPPKVDPFKAHRERVTDVAEALRQLGDMTSLAAQVTYMPIWRRGRRPVWWSNIALRELLTECHRQVTLQEALDEARRRFPDCRLSMSALQRYWAKLDAARGLLDVTPERRAQMKAVLREGFNDRNPTAGSPVFDTEDRGEAVQVVGRVIRYVSHRHDPKRRADS